MTQLSGGDDFDKVIVSFLLEQIKSDIVNGANVDTGNLLGKQGASMQEAAASDNHGDGSDLKGKRKVFANSVLKAIRGGKDHMVLNRLHDAAVIAKCTLSNEQSTKIFLPALLGPAYNLETTLTRKRFNHLSKDLLTRILKPLREVAIMSGINLPGESGQLGILEGAFSEDEYEEEGDGDVSSVGDGAYSIETGEYSKSALKKLQAAGRKGAREKRKRKGSTTKEVRRLQKSLGDSSLSIFPGGQQLDSVVLVGGATRIPAIQNLVKTITGADIRSHHGHPGLINPDEAVSLGAAVLAGILDGEIQGMAVLSAWQAEIYRAFGELTAKDFEETEEETEEEKEAKKRPALFKRLRKE